MANPNFSVEKDMNLSSVNCETLEVGGDLTVGGAIRPGTFTNRVVTLTDAAAAGEIGAWKPHPEIFYYALGLANAKPQEAVYVGDNYYADVKGAFNANIQPVLIDPGNVFPGIDCPVICTIGELNELLVAKVKS